MKNTTKLILTSAILATSGWTSDLSYNKVNAIFGSKMSTYFTMEGNINTTNKTLKLTKVTAKSGGSGSVNLTIAEKMKGGSDVTNDTSAEDFYTVTLANNTSSNDHLFNFGPDTTKVNLTLSNIFAPGNCRYMFGECSGLTSLNLVNFDTAKVTEMNSMFQGCSSLTFLNLPASFNTANVTSMRSMFYGCSSLTSLNLDNFNTAAVTNMRYMFDGCSSLTSLNLDNFNTEQVTNMDSMFRECSGLTSLNLDSFNTAAVRYMNYMFYGCSSLTSLNLDNFNTAAVENMNYMFEECSKLSQLIVPSDFPAKGVGVSTTNMFYNTDSGSQTGSVTVYSSKREGTTTDELFSEKLISTVSRLSSSVTLSANVASERYTDVKISGTTNRIKPMTLTNGNVVGFEDGTELHNYGAIFGP